MKTFALCLLSCSILAASLAEAQQPKAAGWLAEINHDVWLPFMEGVNKDQASLYLGVRSGDYIRVQAGSKLILTYPEYVDDTVNMMSRYREQGTKLSIAVRFEERIINGGSASEKGISQVLFTGR